MHYIDLLNYMVYVQGFEKAELAELIAIPIKKVDDVLSGITPLKKKNLKNLSLFTGLPLDTIVSGTFTLNAPQPSASDGDGAPKIAKDAYVPEYIRNANTSRLNAYCKQRYKNELQDVTLLKVLHILFAIGSVFAICSLLLTSGDLSLSNCQITFIVGLLPVILSIISNKATYKLAKAGTPPEGKYFKYYSIVHVIQVAIVAVSIIAFNWATPALVVFGVLSVLPTLYLIFFDNKPLFSKAKTSFYAFFVSLSLALYFIFTIFGEKLYSTENLVYVTGNLSIGFVAIMTTAGCLLANYTYFLKRNNLSKHFAPVSRKRALKSNHIAKSVLSIILSVVVIIGAINILPVIVFNLITNNVIEENTQAEVNYYDYDKENIAFTNTDKYTTLEYDNYSIKIPEGLTKSEETESYSSENNTFYISLTNEFIDYEELYCGNEYDLEFPVDMKTVITEEFGYFPKSEYEYNKLLKEIKEYDSVILNKDLAVVITTFKMTDAIAGYNADIYFYENAELELVVKKHSYQREDGRTAYFYDVYGNAAGDYNKFFEFKIITLNDDSENDIVYKIINSVEFK